MEIANAESDLPAGAERERWKAIGLKASLGVPLLAKDRVVGILSLGDSEPRVFTEDEKRLSMAVGQQASVAIEKADLYQQMADERERLEAIIETLQMGLYFLTEKNG